jgi:hypothetical protein
LAKARGELQHAGGPRFGRDDPAHAAFAAFVARVASPGGCEDPALVDPTAEVPGSPIRRLSPSQLDNTLADLFVGATLPSAGLSPDPLVHGFDNNATTQAATALQINQLHAASLAVTTAALEQPEGWLPCDVNDLDPSCVEGFLIDFGERAFRRPTTADEQAFVQDFYDEMLALDGDPRAALQLTLQGLLLSPDFLYVVEFGADELAPAGSRVPLSGHELASRLSYFLWDSMPDQALFDAAASGELDHADGVEAQAWRMLADPRAERAVGNFHRLWLELDDIAHIAPYEAAFPSWEPAMNDAARAEIDQLVWSSAFGPDPTLTNLLLSRQTTVDPSLAGLYGVAPEAVELPANQRAGLLTRAGWLGATSHEVYASPVQRGVFVLKRLLCVPPAPPPANVDTSLEEGTTVAVTNRERYSAHAADPLCASCHTSIDGIGFGFENYDAIGAWRDVDNGAPVDATGAFADGDLSGTSYNGALEMSALLASSETVHRCSVTQWYRYALGRSEELGDEPTLDALTAAYWGTGGELPQLLVDLVRTDSFRTRRAE